MKLFRSLSERTLKYSIRGKTNLITCSSNVIRYQNNIYVIIIVFFFRRNKNVSLKICPRIDVWQAIERISSTASFLFYSYFHNSCWVYVFYVGTYTFCIQLWFLRYPDSDRCRRTIASLHEREPTRKLLIQMPVLFGMKCFCKNVMGQRKCFYFGSISSVCDIVNKLCWTRDVRSPPRVCNSKHNYTAQPLKIQSPQSRTAITKPAATLLNSICTRSYFAKVAAPKWADTFHFVLIYTVYNSSSSSEAL